MAIDVSFTDGSAEVNTFAAWIDASAVPAIESCVEGLGGVQANAETVWESHAGEVLRGRLARARSKTSELVSDLEMVSRSLRIVADDMCTVKAMIGRAVRVAQEAGLPVTDDRILAPGPIRVSEDQQAAAYRAAQEIVSSARGIERRYIDKARSVWADQAEKAPLLIADFVTNSALNAAIGIRGLQLADVTRFHHWRAAQLHKWAKAGSAFGPELARHAHRSLQAARAAGGRSLSFLSKAGARTPLVGIAFAAAGTVYDIKNGKPAGKAILSSSVSVVAGSVAGAVAGSALTAVAGPVVGAVGGVAVGMVVGTAYGYAADALYDALPDGVTDAFERGVGNVGTFYKDVGVGVWEKGGEVAGDVKDTIDKGAEKVKDVGSKVGEGVRNVGGAIKSIF